MTDWQEIRAEYIQGGISLRKLAAKHGVSESTLMKKCRAEKWRKQQEAVSRKADELAVQRIAEIAADVQVNYAERVKDIAYHLADELEKTIKFMAQDGAIPAGELRKLIAAAKDLWSMSVNETVSDSGDTGVIELPRRIGDV